MRTRLKKKAQILGCILGGALGDAWGGPWEGNSGRVTFQIPSRSSVSDDTQLTLATCESIIEHGGIHVERLASHFATWFAAGRITRIGASTLKAMRDLEAGVHWALAGSRGEYSGAAMRIAPLAFLLDPSTPAAESHITMKRLKWRTRCGDSDSLDSLGHLVEGEQPFGCRGGIHSGLCCSRPPRRACPPEDSSIGCRLPIWCEWICG